MSAPKPCLLCGTPKCKRWPCVRRWACKECYTRKGWGDKLKIGCERSSKTYKEIAALISRSPSTLHKYPRYVCVSECENCGAGVVSGNFGTPKEAVLDARQRFAGIIAGTVKTKDEIATVKADLHKKYWRLCHAESVATDDININFGPKKLKKNEAW